MENKILYCDKTQSMLVLHDLDDTLSSTKLIEIEDNKWKTVVW
jgi:hypothetical protein